MINDPVILDKCIFYYEEAISFADNLKKICIDDAAKWKVNNEPAASWEPGKKNLGYDEYEVDFSFDNNYQWIKMGKGIWDIAKNYSSTNLVPLLNQEKPTVRKYSSAPGFLELEYPNQNNTTLKFSSILFLNDCNGGGEVSFKHFNISVPPKMGAALFFPSSFAYAFKINKPKESDNFVVVSNFV